MLIIASNITELKVTQGTVARLRRLLPICSWCGRIRTNEGTWETVEGYPGKKLETQVTHGLCSECHRKVLEGVRNRDGTGGSNA